MTNNNNQEATNKRNQQNMDNYNDLYEPKDNHQKATNKDDQTQLPTSYQQTQPHAATKKLPRNITNTIFTTRVAITS